jgi:hypothetical protein
MGGYAALPRRDAAGPGKLYAQPIARRFFRPGRRRARQYEPIITTALRSGLAGSPNYAHCLASQVGVVSDPIFSVRQLRPAAGKGDGPVSWVLSPLVVLAPSELRPSIVPRTPACRLMRSPSHIRCNSPTHRDFVERLPRSAIGTTALPTAKRFNAIYVLRTQYFAT